MKAQLTLDAINWSLEQDGGNRYRELLRAEFAAAAANPSFGGFKHDDGYRTHLGASVLGGSCEREMWMSFRWCSEEKISGDLIRLFNRGHLEELRLIALLKLIGCEVWERDQNGKQFRIKGYKGHVGGSLDCVIRGIPDAPSVAMPAEFKTHAEKQFNMVVKEGVQKAFGKHHRQMLLYMHEYRFTCTLYVACNKNTDELYLELVPAIPELAAELHARSERIIDASVPPIRISGNPGWFVCKSCGQHPVCHGRAPVRKTCRSCVHVKVLDNKEWLCGEHGHVLSLDDQKAACDDWDPIIEIKKK